MRGRAVLRMRGAERLAELWGVEPPTVAELRRIQGAPGATLREQVAMLRDLIQCRKAPEQMRIKDDLPAQPTS